MWPVPEAKSVPDWQKTLGETLANHLTNCGFQSTPRGERVQFLLICLILFVVVVVVDESRVYITHLNDDCLIAYKDLFVFNLNKHQNLYPA